MPYADTKTIDLIIKSREYLEYIEEHILYVKKAWLELQAKCKHEPFVWDDYLFWSIDNLIDKHDMSKLSEEEFVQYRKAFYPVNESERTQCDEAFEHHKECNSHHWENWTSKEYYNPYEATVHCVCMVCDWMAISQKGGTTAQKYYETNKDKIKLSEWAVEFIYKIFEALQEVATDAV